MIFQIVSSLTRLTALEIPYSNFEISLVVFMPNITTNRAITYTNLIVYPLQNRAPANLILTLSVPRIL